jgi:hypothetical protein
MKFRVGTRLFLALWLALALVCFSKGHGEAAKVSRENVQPNFVADTPAERGVAAAVADTTHGQKHLLFIRAIFPDDPGSVLPTDSNLNTNGAIANSDFQRYSYGQFSGLDHRSNCNAAAYYGLL